MLVYTTGNGVHGFTLDPAIGAFVISHERITMPAQGSPLLGERGEQRQLPRAAIGGSWPICARAQTRRTYSSRYIGSLVADFHRTLLKGGIFLYPPTRSVSRGASCG